MANNMKGKISESSGLWEKWMTAKEINCIDESIIERRKASKIAKAQKNESLG